MSLSSLVWFTRLYKFLDLAFFRNLEPTVITSISFSDVFFSMPRMMKKLT